MKLSTKLTFLIILALAFLWSCSSKKATVETEATSVAQEVKEEAQKAEEQVSLISDEDIGYRNEDLFDESLEIPKVAYSTGAPGTVGNLERSFENAPPMIPHTVNGFVPITAKSNTCLACHLPAVAPALKATAMPKSHFTDYRPEIIEEAGLMKVNAEEGEVIAKDMGSNLNQARYNCTLCHAPQANVTIQLKNEFNPFFRSENDAKKSNLDQNIGEGVK